MDLTTYAGLKAAVASFMNRTDQTASIPGFIALAEAAMRREITSIGQIDTWADVEIDESGFSLPCRVDEVASVSVNGRAIGFVSSDRFAVIGAGEPASYTIDGGVLRVSPAGTVTVRLKSAICPLSASVRTNWILRDHPDAYLYGALTQSAPFMENDERISVWGGLFRAAIDSINKHAVRRQTGGNVRIQAGQTP